MRKLLVAILLVAATPAMAKNVEIRQCGTGCQQDFDSMSQDLIATIDYKALGPAEATGVTGIGVGLVMDYVPVDKAAWKNITASDVSGLGLVGLQVTKGLPLDIDVGAFYSAIPSTGIKIYGGEVRYAFLPGSTVAPAIAVRGSYDVIHGVDSYSASSKAVDVSLSKGFAFITPYVGVGYVWGSVDPKEPVKTLTGLHDSDVKKTKADIGVRLSMGLFEVTPEVGEVGSDVTYALRAGFSF